MSPKHSKNSSSKPNPNCISTHPKNAATHPGQIIQTLCSTRCPESIIQAKKAEKAAKCAKKEQSIKQNEAAEAIAKYEQDMAINDAIEDAQFPRHQDKAGMSYRTCRLLLCPNSFLIHQQFEAMDLWNDPMLDTRAHLVRRER